MGPATKAAVHIALNASTALHLQGLIHSPPNSLIICGPAGCGKKYMTQTLLTEYFVSSRTQTAQHPFITWLEPIEGKAISIKQVRSLDHIVRMRVPTQSDQRSLVSRAIIVYPSKQVISLPAQNALLKLLEEPPEGTIIIIVTNHLNALLPTIVSRSQLLQVFKPSKANLQSCFDKQGIHTTGSVFESAYTICGGLPGLMHAYISQNDHPLKAAVATARQLLGETAYNRLAGMDALVKNKQLTQDVLQVIARMASLALQTAKGGAILQWENALVASITAQNSLLASAQAKLVLTNFMLNL